MSKQRNWFDIQKELFERALQDPAFKAELLTDAKACIEKTYHCHLPETLTIEPLQEQASRIHLLIPMDSAELDQLSGILSDEQLAAVSGGASPYANGIQWTGFQDLGSDLGHVDFDDPLNRGD